MTAHKWLVHPDSKIAAEDSGSRFPVSFSQELQDAHNASLFSVPTASDISRLVSPAGIPIVAVRRPVPTLTYLPNRKSKSDFEIEKPVPPRVASSRTALYSANFRFLSSIIFSSMVWRMRTRVIETFWI